MRILKFCAGFFLLILFILSLFTLFSTQLLKDGAKNIQFFSVQLLLTLTVLTFSLKLFSKPEKTTIDTDRPVYAGFGLRALAVIIDGMIFMGLYLLIRPLENHSLAFYVIYTYAITIFAYAFQIFFLVKFGATPGKLIMKIKVVKTSLEPISFKEALLRLSVNILFSVLVLVAITIAFKSFSYETYRLMGVAEKGKYIVSFYPSWFKYQSIFSNLWLWAELTVLLFNRKKRAIHDFIAETVVIVRPEAYKRYGFATHEKPKEQEEPSPI